MDLSAAVLGFAWISLAWHRSAYERARRLHVRCNAHVDVWGIVFFSHQLGSFLGGWGAGRLYDIQGNYDLMWWISVGLGVFAAVIHWVDLRAAGAAPGNIGGAGMSTIGTGLEKNRRARAS